MTREPIELKICCSSEPIRESHMAAKKKTKTTRGRAQDRARVAGGQDYEVQYEAKKTGKKPSAVRKAIKKIGNSRKKVSSALKGR